jgi:hypothetical protein
MTAMTQTERERIIAKYIRTARNDALDAAIEICDLFASTGHSAECCAAAIRDLKEKLPKPPSDQN